jgi:hypothetical protein
MPAGLCLLIELQKFSVGTHKLIEFRPGECAKLRDGLISWDEMDNQAGICPQEDELQLRAPARVATLHPLREIRTLTDGVLQSLDPELDKLYAATGRASVAPEYVLRALLLQAFY